MDRWTGRWVRGWMDGWRGMCRHAADGYLGQTDRQTDRPLPPLQLPGMEVQGALQDGAHHRQGAPGTAQPGGTGTRWRQRGHPERPPSMCRGRWHRVSAAVRPPLISVQAGARFPVTCCPPGPGPRGGRRGGVSACGTLTCSPHISHGCACSAARTPTTTAPQQPLCPVPCYTLPANPPLAHRCCNYQRLLQGKCPGSVPAAGRSRDPHSNLPFGQQSGCACADVCGFFLCACASLCIFKPALHARETAAALCRDAAQRAQPNEPARRS